MLQRLTFNAGELAPELQWRSDLARYFSGCRQLRNFVVTPYGGVRRRYPLRPMACMGAVSSGRGTNDYRVLPFRYSEDTAYLVVLDALAEEIRVYSTAGTLKATISSSPYTANLYQIHTCQSNDVMWLFDPDPTIPTYRLERSADTSWALVVHPYKHGPWRTQNTDRGAVISITAAVWDSSTAYTAGAVVQYNATSTALTAIGWKYWYGVNGYSTDGYPVTDNHYYTTLTVASASGINAGDTIRISGTTYHDGNWTVQKVVGSVVYIDTGVYKTGATWHNKHTDTPGAESKVWTRNAGFYEAIADNTNKTPSSETAYWRSTAGYRGTVELASQKDLFSTDMVGGHIRLELETSDDLHTGGFDADGESSLAYPAYGTVKLTSGGRWGGELTLQQSLDGGATWTDIGNIASNNADYNGSIEREITDLGAMVRAYMTDYAEASESPTDCTWKLEFATVTVPVSVAITYYTDARHVTAVTDDVMAAFGQTWRWSEGAFSPKNGYPRAGCIFDERLMVGGTLRDPHFVWGSAINDWEDFCPGNLDTSPVSFGLAADKLQTVQSLVPKQNLIVLTDGGEWTMGPRDATTAITGSNILSRRHTEVGSAAIQAVAAAGGVFFVQRGRKAVRSVEYSYEADGYQSLDVSILARHLCPGNLREIAYQRVPWATLWLVRDDGYLVSFTYDRDQEVAGWALHDTSGTEDDGGFLSVCVLPGDDGDDVWCLVQRFGYVYLERMYDPGDDFEWDGESLQLQPFTSWLDWRFYTGAAAGDKTSVTLLAASTELESAGLVVYGDGRLLDETEYTLTQNSETKVWTVTTTDEYYRIDVGIPYESRVKPTDPAADTRAGTSPGERVRVSEVDAFLVDSVGGETSVDDGTTYADLPWLDTTTVPGYPLIPDTCRKKLKQTAGHTEGALLAVRTTNAGPMHLAALTCRLELTRE